MLAAPFEFAVAILFLVSGVGLGQALVKGNPTTLGHALPEFLLWVWAAMIGAGALGMLYGILSPGTTVMSRAVERSGLYLSLAAWSTLGAVVIWTEPTAWATYVQVFAIVSGCALRLRALYKVEKVIDRAVCLPLSDEEDQ